MKKNLAWGLIAAGFLSACGGDESTIESKEEAAELANVVQNVIAQAQMKLALGNLADPETASARVEQSGTLDCEGGGTVKLTMIMDADTSSSSSVSGSVKYEAEFNNCESEKVVLNGDFKMDAKTKIELDSVASQNADISLTGRVEASGKIEGVCVYDVNMKMNVSQSSADISISGSVCGYDAEESLGNINFSLL